MTNAETNSPGLQPLSLEDVAGIIGGTTVPVDIGTTGPSGGSQNPTPNPNVDVHIAK